MKNIFGINWGVRIHNKWFWITIIPAAFLVIKAGAQMFGFDIELTEVQDKLVSLVEAVFALLSTLGIVVDQTTKGIGDSERALTYVKPSVAESENDA